MHFGRWHVFGIINAMKYTYNMHACMLYMLDGMSPLPSSLTIHYPNYNTFIIMIMESKINEIL
jgi:hypothetical protein